MLSLASGSEVELDTLNIRLGQGIFGGRFWKGFVTRGRQIAKKVAVERHLILPRAEADNHNAKTPFSTVEGCSCVEAEIAMRLRHRNVARCLDYSLDSASGVVFITLASELCDGCLQQETDFDKKKRWDVLRQVVDGLAAIHELGVSHGDIRPENVFVKSERKRVRYKIGGFGFARKCGEDAAAKSDDMRRLGLLLAFTLSGHFACDDSSDAEVAHFLADLEKTDAKLADILTGLLHWNPLARTPSRTLKGQLDQL